MATKAKPKQASKKAVPSKSPSLPSEQRLTLKQKAFCKALVDPDAETYSNATKSALKTYNTTDYMTAATIGHDNLNNPKLQNYIERLLDDHRAGSKVRATKLGDILHSDTIGTIQTVRSSDGTQTTKRGPSYSEVIKAVDIANKMSGLYDRQRVEADTQGKVLNDLIQRHLGQYKRDRRGDDADSA